MKGVRRTRGSGSWVTKKGFKRPDHWARPGPKSMTDTQIAECVNMRKSGMSYREIAAEIGYSHTTVRKEVTSALWVDSPD